MFEITTKWHKASDKFPERKRKIIACYRCGNIHFLDMDDIDFCANSSFGRLWKKQVEYWTYADEILSEIEKSAEADEAATTDSENQLSTV